MNTSVSSGPEGPPVATPSTCRKCSSSNVNFTLSVHDNNKSLSGNKKWQWKVIQKDIVTQNINSFPERYICK
ncbi:unnamed protein product [Schistosoma margrebowiei]|uniref:Uncharacterized protein n=1 Tax=Schistosoma margrebowiei TaxID=48269 RepID=A0A183NBQ4_9TREM|nr:unnamed protein product [Schistosoma margrebowiei]